MSFEPMTPFQASDRSLADAIVTMTGWQEAGGTVVREAGMLFAVARSRFPTLYSNAAFALRPEAGGRRLLSRAEEVFSDRRYVVWSRGVPEDDLEALCREHGFLSLGDTPAMVIENRVPLSLPAKGVEVARAETAADFREFVDVSKQAYLEAGLPEAVAERTLSNAEAALASSVIAVARSEGRAIAAALVLTNADTRIAGIYWVGTVPAARRRGAADAVTRFVTNAAFDGGADIVTLQASAAGEPVYRRIGYREVGRYGRFLSPPRESRS